MKKVLSIVLALAMVLCMIPVLGATVTKTEVIEKKPYDLRVECLKVKAGKTAPTPATEDDKNSIEFKYDYEVLDASGTGKWSDGRPMALITVDNFEFLANSTDLAITINGKKLDVSQNADYYSLCQKQDNKVVFPAELTEAGYSEDYLIVATWKVDEGATEVTEIAKVAVKFTNTNKPGKAEKEAIITDIKLADTDFNKGKAAQVYIVGSKIYVDFEKYIQPVDIAITFADENKAAFSCITYAWDEGGALKPTTASYDGQAKLDKSVGIFRYDAKKTDVEFKLETEANKYKVAKKYDFVPRAYIHEEDPKGIYLDKAEVSIAVGDVYVPVVKTASKGATVTPTSVEIISGKDFVDFDKESGDLIGIRPGVAYIKATYAKTYSEIFGKVVDGFSYTTSAQKVTVTVPGTVIPAQTVDYVVTCRNLNVRKGAGTSYAKAGMVHRGDVLKVVEIANGWAKLADGTYVCAKYITK